MKTIRNSSFEYLKIIAILMICLSSSLPFGAMYNGAYANVFVNLKYTDFTIEGVLFTLFRYLGQIGDDIFIMCSAWFLCEITSLKISKSIKLVLDSFVISIIGLAVASAFIKLSFREIIRSVFPVTSQTNWFVGCYIIYYLLCPLLNNAVKDFDRKQFFAFDIVLFLAYSVVATIYPRYYFTRLVAFISIHYYILYAKRFKIFEHNKRKDAFAIIVAFFAIISMIIGVSFLGRFFSFINSKNLYLCQFYNPLLIILTLPMVFIAAKCRMYSNAVNYFSSLSLLIYLFHGNYFWQAYGKYAVLEYFGNIGIPKVYATLVLFFCVVCITCLIATIYKGTLSRITHIVSIHLEQIIGRHLEVER